MKNRLHLIADDWRHAFEIEEKFNGLPRGCLQWHATDVCMDIHCKCGNISHINGRYVYEVKCPHCGTTYSVNGHVQLIELINPSENSKIADG